MRNALVEAVYHVPENGKAEIVHGGIVRLAPAGVGPGRTAARIALSLYRHEDQPSARGGLAFGSTVGFLVELPGRGSFSPDAAWYVGTLPENEMDFLPGAPAFAAEVRSKNDYGPKADREIAEKIRDYFAAGTQVVWDVDTLGRDVIKVYRASDPAAPTIYRRGDVAEAEPAVPGWAVSVDGLLPPATRWPEKYRV